MCHAAEGFDRIVLRGTDSPTLPLARIDEAFDALEHAELVLCPDRDGGYNLIGLRGACDGLFALELSHAGVLSQTLVDARALGLRAELLPAHHDVDTLRRSRCVSLPSSTRDSLRERCDSLATAAPALTAYRLHNRARRHPRGRNAAVR